MYSSILCSEFLLLCLSFAENLGTGKEIRFDLSKETVTHQVRPKGSANGPNRDMEIFLAVESPDLQHQT
jgi:hypothetical protein